MGLNGSGVMATYPHIEQYRADLSRLIEFGGSVNEQSIRAAFQICLSAYCADHKEQLELVPELPYGAGVIPDGTVKDSLRMPRGYWEAKDTLDDLDTEIQIKLDRGYPRDNIIFENSETAVLIQNREVSMRVDMARSGDLHRLIRRFLDYELPEIGEFRTAQRQFKVDLPWVIGNLRESVEEAKSNSAAYQSAAAEFLDLCRESISPSVSEEDVREMLLQHILTKDIFLRVFREDQFHRENNVARQLDELERSFFTGDARRQAISRLQAYYGAIGRAADEIADYAEKQGFLKAVYEDFYTAYNPAAADRLGVVYTPNEIVDFIIRGVDYLLGKHFGRSLADENVQILDPATGTGTFVTSLIERLPADRLEYKYVHEIHANEVAILPYYIANLNIEYTYKEKTGRYLEFPNLCFVDTLDNMDWQENGTTNGVVERQGGFNLGGLSVDNLKRIQEQNEKTISVIMGNPPYNANQGNWNEFNPNREYPKVDRRIRETYIANSAAQKTKQYDMYKRFIRWASDRLAEDGIMAFVTNRGYLDKFQDDGFRKVSLEEFNDVYVVDLGGDVRGNERVGNVFGIMTGVAIGFFVRSSSSKDQGKVHYYAVSDEWAGTDKLLELQKLDVGEMDFAEIAPDRKGNWLNQINPEFERLLPIADRKTKLVKTDYERAVFGLYMMGVVTARDEWVYDFDPDNLGRKVRRFINSYEETRAIHGGRDVDNAILGTSIKWTRDLKRQIRLDVPIVFDRTSTRQALYRPFVIKSLYFNQNLNEMQYQIPRMFPGNYTDHDNEVICFQATSARRPFAVLATDRIPDLHVFFDGTQCLPLYRYTADGERVSNITEWGLRRVREHYGEEEIRAEDVFAYTYGVLHDPAYRQKYAVDLLQEFPRLPLYRDFESWTKMGRELLDLHIGFESVEPYPLEIREKDGVVSSRARLRADVERGLIMLDDRTTLAGIPREAWEYRLGSRSALEWVLDQYKERKPRDPTIRERFDTYRFADYKERVVDLLGRVCAVSVRTTAAVGEMEGAER